MIGRQNYFGQKSTSKKGCHPERALFAQREPAPSEAEGTWASRAMLPALSKRSASKGRVLCDAIVARLARFPIPRASRRGIV
jgi:hypothetical protein